MEAMEKMSLILELIIVRRTIDGRNRNILVLDEGATQGLDNATITAEAKYPVSFTESGKRFVLSFLFVHTVKMCRFKAKN